MGDEDTRPANRRGRPKGTGGTPVTGALKPVADQSAWRRRMRANRLKFDDAAKATCLERLAEHGLRGRAATEAGVTLKTVHHHLEADPEFAEAYDQALVAYRDKFVDHATTLAYEGVPRVRYGKGGEVVEETRDYPVRLIELELKRVEPAYRDRPAVDHTHRGGVMVAPADMEPEEFIEKMRRKAEEARPPPGIDDVLDADYEDVTGDG
jgi:hypothetical protein